MEALFLKYGFVLSDGKEPNKLLHQNQTDFQKKLSDHLQHAADDPRVTEELTEDLSKYIRDEDKFLIALQSTILVDSGNSEQQNQSSLFDLLLGINSIQKVVATLLFEKLAELSGLDEYTHIISTLRTSLEFTIFTKNTQQIERKRSDDRSQIIDILEKIKAGIGTKATVFEAWNKVIRDDLNPENEVIDLFIILILHSVPNKETTADDLLRSRIKCGLFGEKSLTAIFENYYWAMTDFFDVSSKIATKFLKFDQEMFLKFGMSLYKNLYANFELGYKQMVIGNLLDHVESDRSDEVDCALSVVKELAKNNPEQVASFNIDIDRIINCLDRLALHQIRSMYSTLSILACRGGRKGEQLRDYLTTIIQNQLTNSDLKWKRIGVVGSLMLVKQLTRVNDESDDESYDNEPNEQNSERALNLLKYLLGALENEKIALALVYDDITHLLATCTLDQEIEVWIKDTVMESFSDKYLLEFTGRAQDPLQFSLCDDDEGGVMLNLYPMIERETRNVETNTSKKGSVLTLCSQFRLLQISESISTFGHRDGLDTLLECPIRLFDMDKLEKFSTVDADEKDLICSALFYTLNWFRELLNAFACQGCWKTRFNVISRLKSITYLEIILKKCLASNPDFRPPLIHFDADYFVTKSRKIENEELDKPANKKLEEIATLVEETQLRPVPSTSVSEDATKRSIEEEVVITDLSQYAPYFRELFFGVSYLLKEETNLSNAAADSELDENFLTPLELIFLLKDLKLKLKFKLQPLEENLRGGPPTEFSPFAHFSLDNVTEVVGGAVDLIPHLCLHMESVSDYFRNVNADVMNSAEYRNDSSLVFASCLELIVECLCILLSWKEFDHHRTLQERAVRYLADRLSSFAGSQLNVEDSVNQAFEYVMKISESLPNLSCAVAVLTLGEKLCAINKSEDNLNRLCAKAELFLTRQWPRNGESESGLKRDQQLKKILALLFKLNPDSRKLLQPISIMVASPKLIEDQIELKTILTNSIGNIGNDDVCKNGKGKIL